MFVIAQTEYMTFRASAHQRTRVSTGRIKNRRLVEGLMANVLTLDEVDLEGRTVLVRVDINSPLDPETNVFLDDIFDLIACAIKLYSPDTWYAKTGILNFSLIPLMMSR